MRQILISSVVCLALVACDSKKATDTPPEGADKTPTAATKKAPEPAKPAEPAKPVVDEPVAVVETDADKAKQCAALIDKSWKALAPGYAKAKIKVTPELEAYYRESARRFLKGCASVSKPYRDCLSKAALPTENVRPCSKVSKLREDAIDNLYMVAPRDTAKYPTTAVNKVFIRENVDAATAKATLAKLKGTWKQLSHGRVVNWVIGSGGKTAETRGKVAEPESMKEKTFTLLPKTDTTVDVQFSSNNQARGFAWLSDTEFVMEGNLMWTPSFMGDGTTFDVRSGHDAVFYDDGKCEALTIFGSLVPATCAFADRDGKRFFDVSYQVPGKLKWRSDTPDPTKVSFGIAGEYLINTTLLAMPFVKQ